jgi:hypothetical protein
VSLLQSADDMTGHVFSENLRAFRAWRAQPVAISDTQQGEDALIAGHVETAGFVERAPISGRDCVACVLTFLFLRTQIDGRFIQRGGTPIARVRATQPFFVIDAQGDRLLVKDADMIVRVAPDDVSDGLMRIATPGSEMEAFMRARGLLLPAQTGYDAQEQLILPGAPIEVFGRVSEIPWLERTAYREAVTNVRAMIGADLARVVVRPRRDLRSP